MGRAARWFIPRSLAGWFAACWGLFLLAAIVAGAALVSLYRDGTTERMRRAEAALARGCDAIAERYRFATAGAARIDWEDPEVLRTLTAATLVALRDLPGVEGGLWRAGAGPLAYAYPTYEGAGPKTDVPAAELPRIGEAAEAAILRGLPVGRRYDARTQALLLRACPLPGPSLNLAAWVMDRVILFGGPAYVRAAVALAVLTAVLLGSAAWLGWLLWGWAGRLRRIEAALAGAGAEDLPRLAPTGQRDLDRVVQAVNGAAGRLAEARRA
ncbi:sensor histidine kinase, partial [Paracraurococcus ruber]